MRVRPVGDDRDGTVRRFRDKRASPLRWLREFAMWKTPRSTLAFILAVEAVCVTYLIVGNVFETPDSSDLRHFALLFVIAAVYSEGADRIERLRRFAGYVDNSVIFEGSGQWCLAAALVLPPGLAGLFVALLYGHTLLRTHRHRSAVPYRMVYTAATVVLSAMASSSLIAATDVPRSALGTTGWSLLAVVAAFATYMVINNSLVFGVIYLVRRPTSLRSIMLKGSEWAMECATLTVGVLLAVAVVHAPWVSPAAVLVIIVLRRSALVHELQVQATHDAKTGLLNAGAWRAEADRELVRAERIDAPLTVLMIDLDHFKVLNDAHGHQAGDVALKAVADCITEALRGYDAVGRFGGEEFIALLADADARQATSVANRLCDRIRELRLAHGGTITASVGVGVGRSGLHGLDDLIAVADQALYAAKNTGRDRVHTMHAVTAPSLGSPLPEHPLPEH